MAKPAKLKGYGVLQVLDGFCEGMTLYPTARERDAFIEGLVRAYHIARTPQPGIFSLPEQMDAAQDALYLDEATQKHLALFFQERVARMAKLGV